MKLIVPPYLHRNYSWTRSEDVPIDRNCANRPIVFEIAFERLVLASAKAWTSRGGSFGDFSHGFSNPGQKLLFPGFWRRRVFASSSLGSSPPERKADSIP